MGKRSLPRAQTAGERYSSTVPEPHFTHVAQLVACMTCLFAEDEAVQSVGIASNIFPLWVQVSVEQ
jgi:hypothetical protein